MKDTIVKNVSTNMLDSSYCVPFNRLLVVTKEGFLKQGAILLEVIDPNTGEYSELWFPKSICANIEFFGEEDATKNTDGLVYVWEKFIRDQKPWMVEALELQTGYQIQVAKIEQAEEEGSDDELYFDDEIPF